MKANPQYKSSTGEVFYKGKLIGEMIIEGCLCWSNVDFEKYKLKGCKLELLDES